MPVSAQAITSVVGDVEGDDPGGRGGRLELPRRSQAHGRRDVEQDRVRRLLELGQARECVRHVPGGPDDVEPRVASQQPARDLPGRAGPRR